MPTTRDFKLALLLDNDGLTVPVNQDITLDGNTLFVDASTDRVGIGTTSPDRLFEVEEASGDAYIRLRASDTGGGADTIFENLCADNGQNNYIYFGDLDDVNIGIIRYSHASDFMSFTTNALERMRITSSGDVGIGTSSPASTLTVSDGTASGLTPFGDTDLFLNSSGDNYLQFGSGTSSSPAIYFGDSADGDVGGIIYAHASDAMSFRTNAAERMRINSSGNVGIGTSSPAFISGSYTGLHINGATGTSLHITNNTTGTTGSDGFDINLDTSGNASYINRETSGYQRWYTGGSERMRIDSSGNVGIGTNSPSYKLDVVGDINFTGTLRQNGSAYPVNTFAFFNYAGTQYNISLSASSQLPFFDYTSTSNDISLSAS
jgi:hypothetical protein